MAQVQASTGRGSTPNDETSGDVTTREVGTTCPYCGVGCGVLARPAPDGAVTVRGDPEHPANFGRLCSKGMALPETLGLEGRLLHPEIAGRRAGWDEATALVAEKFAAAIAQHGPDSVAFYVSGQLLTEDYYVANKLMKGFIGSANIDTNSRLCMASAVAGHRRAFGSDTVPGNYEDIELADLVVIVGSNLAWCHPVLYQRLAAEKERRPAMRIVVVDPRRTVTADIADLHLPIRADGDLALFEGLLAFLAESGALDRAYIDAHTSGFEQALALARRTSLAELPDKTGLNQAELLRFFQLFAVRPKTVTLFSQGVNQSARGADKVNAIINIYLATGRIGKPGAGPFSVTGQPNAMGGREVGGMANMLAAHMDIENPAHRARVQRFWGSPRIAEQPGLKAVDLFQALADGRIKALWIMGTNPVDSMPDADAVADALAGCPFVVVSDVVSATDTMRYAHVKLPAAAWGEKDGTVTNSERRISRQRPFLPLPGEARPDWRIISDVAAGMGFGPAFNYASPAEIFAEHAALSTFENGGERAFDIGAKAGTGVAAYDRLEPFQWPAPAGLARDPRLTGSPGPAETLATPTRRAGSSMRVFANGRFHTSDGRARFVPSAGAGAAARNTAWPLTLNTGRVRDHWHTMTRTGRSPRLSQHMAEPFAEIHPADAQRAGISDAEIVRVSTPRGAILVRALISRRAAVGSIFVPMHWNDQFTASARVGRLVEAVTDPVSGQPALKSSLARVERFAAEAYGFAVTRRRPNAIHAEYWSLAACPGGWRIELAFAACPADWERFAGNLFGLAEAGELLAYEDGNARQHRFASFRDGILEGALFVAPKPVAVSRGWAVAQLGEPGHARNDRFRLAAGQLGADRPDAGAIVCSCFNVGVKQIAAAAAAGCVTLAAVGQALRAGTNCGSCRAEIKAIVDARALAAE